jgi:hypothetical protein
MMIETIVLAVLKPLVSKLTEDFLDGRRNKVAIADLQDQVLRLLRSQREMEIEISQARMAVLALTRYLALTQSETFVLRRDPLELVISSKVQELATVDHAIQDFDTSVKARLHRESNRTARSHGTPSSSNSVAAKGPTSHARDASSGALDRFFDGFEEEIMRARLGREESND